MDPILKDTEAQEIITSIISAEDLMKYFQLEAKVKEVEKLLAEKEYEVNKELLENNAIKDNEGPIPHTLKINITTEVLQVSNSKYKEPTIVEKISKDYIIDFSIKNHSEFVDEFYSLIQSTLEQTCKKIFKKEDSDGNI